MAPPVPVPVNAVMSTTSLLSVVYEFLVGATGGACGTVSIRAPAVLSDEYVPVPIAFMAATLATTKLP